jgi:hypothetical protein
MITKSTYVCTLPEVTIIKIKNRLKTVAGMTKFGITNMLDGRLGDMEEVIGWDELQIIVGR